MIFPADNPQDEAIGRIEFGPRVEGFVGFALEQQFTNGSLMCVPVTADIVPGFIIPKGIQLC